MAKVTKKKMVSKIASKYMHSRVTTKVSEEYKN